MKVFVISGRSGSGKSTVLHALEDAGYTCIDNFPVLLLNQLIDKYVDNQNYNNLAVSIDARSPSSELYRLPDVLQSLTQESFQPRLVYLDAQSSVLVKRFDETRRRHPLEQIGSDLVQCIDAETNLLAHLADIADLKIDTTNLSQHELTRLTNSLLIKGDSREIVLLFRSFAFRNGVPVDADFVFDVRCLPNPHWDVELAKLSGRDKKVQEFFQRQELVTEMQQQIVKFLTRWLQVFEQHKRAYVTVAVGCTGGRHRSVYMTEQLAQAFRKKYSNVLTRHREEYGKSA
ncbi:MAG: RNase adapter RapZ [Gammaproteobacteria bacterium]|nr:RNase adapter RapZ [Gammaproteobacteria bacterium]MXX95625.1 RNase adapter RapZ [Gammaproteobacteria bacterium]MYF53958.1 RNase adapter RapZ [Gammaproteobacteria bacterium]MYK43684.1 RNase adapter RapZ [Gammaproteobacteria bacterium]